MEISKFRLSNIGRFERLDVPLAPTEHVSSNVTVLVGNNGAGKTSLLKSLATSLSWLVARIRSEKGNGSPIPEEVIRNGANAGAIDIDLIDTYGQMSTPNENHLYSWTIAKTRKGRKGDLISNLQPVSELAGHYRMRLSEDENISLPLIAFYSVERVVLDIPLKIRGKHNFFQLDGYDNSLSQGVDFRRFFEWFRDREDSENESGVSQDLLDMLDGIKDQGGSSLKELWEKLSFLKASSRDRQLTAVRTAISSFMPEFSDLRVRRKPRLHMSVNKNGETLNVAQLSQGEKSLMTLIGDIARRLAMMNPVLENPLEGDGIVLIDEVDMHLHPKWQRSLITRLVTTFPNCQFVLSTHSPLVISDHKDVLLYMLDDGDIIPVSSLYGQDANSVLMDVMNTDVRNTTVNRKLHDLLDAIQDKQLELARQLLAELESELPQSNIEILKARLLLRKQELRHA